LFDSVVSIERVFLAEDVRLPINAKTITIAGVQGSSEEKSDTLLGYTWVLEVWIAQTVEIGSSAVWA
jgi:hypothetical protein